MSTIAADLHLHVDSKRSASQQAHAALANPHDYPEGIRMPHAKFRADPLKTVAVHNEQRNITDIHIQFYIYVYKMTTQVNSTCNVFEIRAFVFESIRGPLTLPDVDLPRVPRDRPRSS